MRKIFSNFVCFSESPNFTDKSKVEILQNFVASSESMYIFKTFDLKISKHSIEIVEGQVILCKSEAWLFQLNQNVTDS